ncbi:hypothetical protein TCAL_07958 [Tigriopus californicus]|uniref:C2H2-type domain-containing protein n=1 Tax=Tigriopus californicus TaxID=6832 RepID=A0A553NDW4_TIGCA|nr:zinc finger protein 425-like [Tigriopus californicus]TRY63646.1 hypothetical protein TCAL_07958 [Tigriopus californicus]
MDFSRFLEVIFVEGDETLPNVHRPSTKRPMGPPRPPLTCSVTIEPVPEGGKPVAVIQCPACRHTLKSSEALEVHRRTFHADYSDLSQSIAYPCQECDMTFPRKVLLDEHMICHIRVPLEPSSLDLEQSPQERKSFQCPVCSKRFQTNRLLKQHGKIHDENRVRSHKCPECSSAFFVKYKLARHMKLHKNEVVFKDISKVHQTCGTSGTDWTNVFPCSLCAKTFKSRRLLRAHKAIHAKIRVRSHVCALCSRGFYVKHKLERHLKIHDEK